MLKLIHIASRSAKIKKFKSAREPFGMTLEGEECTIYRYERPSLDGFGKLRSIAFSHIDRKASVACRNTANGIVRRKAKSSPELNIEIFVAAANTYCLVGFPVGRWILKGNYERLLVGGEARGHLQDGGVAVLCRD